MVGCVWEAEGRADVRAGGRVSLQSPLVFLPPCRPSPPRHGDSRGLSGAGTRTDGRVTRYVVALADRRRSTAHEDDAAAVL